MKTTLHPIISRNVFATAAFRFGHSLVRETFSHGVSSSTIGEMFHAVNLTQTYGKFLAELIHESSILRS